MLLKYFISVMVKNIDFHGISKSSTESESWNVSAQVKFTIGKS